VQVAQFAVPEAEPLAEAPVPAAAELLDDPELLQPAASKIDPTAAAAATIVLDARK
jgi:hypothetical protein